ncbi:MAG TPA: small ribosomal subunit Rsm22 family protein [Nitrospirota bacterium]|nr:small ribosomal subunit Rsm22 family protein [Nitrospirota bacterium]
MTLSNKDLSEELTALAADVARLSKLLTKERESLPAAYLKDARLRKAYLSYYLPSNIPKIHLPFKELSLHPKGMLAKEHLRIIDIGAGPGSAMLGVMEFFARLGKSPFLEFTAVDHVAENLKDAATLYASYQGRSGLDASLHTVKTNIEKVQPHLNGHYDLIILSNVLNELFHHNEEKTAKRVDILHQILRRFLDDDGSLIVIEPALRDTSREMLLVRDGLVAQGFHVYSPCLMNENCPALVNPKDWCHEDVPWEPPALIQEIDELAGFRKDSLKFSYLVLRKDGLSLADVYGADAFRIVSEPLVSKGKIEFYLCGKGGRRLIARLDKDKSPANDAFKALKRGDIVSFQELRDEGKRYRAGKDTVVTAKRAC